MALSQLFSLFSEKMDYLTQRQGLIAENISNASTPGYRPKDLVGFDQVLKNSMASSSSAGSFHMTATNTGHIIPVSMAGGNSFRVEKSKDVYEVKPSGNAVNLEQEMMHLAGNNSDYQMITGLYRKTLSLLKTALGRVG
jgi:flagellar basal-body rod protein FlgB